MENDCVDNATICLRQYKVQNIFLKDVQNAHANKNHYLLENNQNC